MLFQERDLGESVEGSMTLLNLQYAEEGSTLFELAKLLVGALYGHSTPCTVCTDMVLHMSIGCGTIKSIRRNRRY